MDLKRRWWRWAFARPHVFLLAWPGAAEVRLTVAREVARRGWPPALAPADADIFIVAGPSARLTESMDRIGDRVWQAMPLPRQRVDVVVPAEVAAKLDHAVAALSDPANTPRVKPPTTTDESTRPDHTAGPYAVPTNRAMGERAMDMNHPAGRPLAGEADDRDGLRLDVLHIALGPALPSWPAGLQLNLVVQGDVVAEASVETLLPGDGTASPAQPSALPARSAAIRALDSLGRLLVVAGADRFALHAARARDDLLAGAPPEAVARDVHRLRRLVSSARVLRPMLERIPAGAAASRDHPTEANTEPGPHAWQRCLQWLDAAEAALSGAAPAAVEDTAAQLAVLPLLISGRDLGEVRLIVAALDPDLDQLLRADPVVLTPETPRG